ncbi:FAD-dependent oxidoreductase [Gulosibacter macacae]|uniref:FAD-dependent oxidoreductase n=1 Tax=Gulosibacter macacae TaxID=2488791 RepID=A0A3P3VYP9_9MICO|nr:FAD-dependent oxidoreductase [Gulosibacter macacae]RRJ87941.1 FAD-dependent oxidoreductase [Gulosibacter macacae]
MHQVTGARERVAIIGAGAIGAAIACELAESGREVVVIDALDTWGLGCSDGNAGYICPSHAGPWATRREMGQAVRWLGKRESPLAMRPLPSLVPFFGQLMRVDETGMRRSGTVNRAMARRAVELHRRLAESGLDSGFRQDGLLDVYRDERRFDDARVIAEQQRADGVDARVVDARGLAALDPGLDVEAVGGVWYPGDAHCDPVRFMRAIGWRAEARGVELMARTRVTSLERHRRGVRVQTSAGAVLADRVVIAAGAASVRLARRPYPMLQGGRGYSVDFTAPGVAAPKRPVVLQEDRVAITPFADRMRVAGMMMFTGLDESIDARRVDALTRAGTRAFPEWGEATISAPWAGLRPCTPDGLPLLGWVNDRVMLATGHAMLGLALAPDTAERVRALFEGAAIEYADALNPRRFSH